MKNGEQFIRVEVKKLTKVIFITLNRIYLLRVCSCFLSFRDFILKDKFFEKSWITEFLFKCAAF